jgi:hypothetical protein
MPRGRELRLGSGSLSRSAHCLFCRQGFVTTLVIVPQAAARATSGHATAELPRSAMNFRRLMGFPSGTQTLGKLRLPHCGRRRLCITTNFGGRCLRWVISVDFDMSATCPVRSQSRTWLAVYRKRAEPVCVAG